MDSTDTTQVESAPLVEKVVKVRNTPKTYKKNLNRIKTFNLNVMVPQAILDGMDYYCQTHGANRSVLAREALAKFLGIIDISAPFDPAKSKVTNPAVEDTSEIDCQTFSKDSEGKEV